MASEYYVKQKNLNMFISLIDQMFGTLCIPFQFFHMVYEQLSIIRGIRNLIQQRQALLLRYKIETLYGP